METTTNLENITEVKNDIKLTNKKIKEYEVKLLSIMKECGYTSIFDTQNSVQLEKYKEVKQNIYCLKLEVSQLRAQVKFLKEIGF